VDNLLEIDQDEGFDLEDAITDPAALGDFTHDDDDDDDEAVDLLGEAALDSMSEAEDETQQPLHRLALLMTFALRMRTSKLM